MSKRTTTPKTKPVEPPKRRLSYEETEERLAHLEGFLIALAVIATQHSDSWLDVDIQDATNAVTTAGREIISELLSDLAERANAK